MARYVGPQGVVKNHRGPGKGINARGSSGGDGFQNRPGADVQTAQASPTIHIPDIGTCGWIFPLNRNTQRG